ncbi:P22 phage major capsid protein family protein [Brachymonas wangyanguii]|uniref:P22 phage major capsid protein family protein n=1 Tax=Brachymonas wangyanguii TaxID=3130163 RepID=UPI00307ECB25
MANTLNGLIPTLYQALDIVSRELVGFIPAVTRNSSAARAALGQAVTYPVAPPVTPADIQPGVHAPDNGDQDIGTGTLTISKSRSAPVRWNGEEQLAVGHTGQYNQILRDQFTQAMRALVNEVERDLGALYVHASRAVGTAGTAPFGIANDFSDFAAVLRTLDDNGTPTTDRQLVLGSAAMANIRGKQSVLFKANEAGTDELLRRGVVGQVEGLDIHHSAGVRGHTAGTGAGYLLNQATGAAIGATELALDTGSGTIVVGDVLRLGGDGTGYLVAQALDAGDLTINAPGLLQAVADNATATVGAAYVGNLGFHRSAIHLVTRAPAMPEGGDAADDVLEVTDPVSGLAFQVAVYRQYRQVRYEVGLAWGVKAVKPEHIALLLG